MFAHYTQLVLRRAWIDLKADAAQNYIGVLWWVLEPLMYMSAFYIVFEIIMERGGPGFVGFLLCGIVFFRWFSSSTSTAANSIMNNRGLLGQIYLPKLLFPLMGVASATMRFGFILALLLIFLSFYTEGPRPIWLLLPALMGVQLLFTLGLGMLIAVFIPIYPDLRKVVENGMLLLFWMSGVFFDLSRLRPAVREWIELNPMAVMLQQYRGLLIDGEMPDWSALGSIVLVSAILLVIGLALMRYYDRKLPNYIN